MRMKKTAQDEHITTSNPYGLDMDDDRGRLRTTGVAAAR